METSSATGSPHAARRVLRSGGRRCTTLGLLALGVAVAVLAVAGGASADQPPPPGICLDVCLPPTQCADLRDNDGDGKVDYPADPGCSSYSDNDETDSVQPPPPP